jgi:micrococcal nuclease
VRVYDVPMQHVIAVMMVALAVAWAVVPVARAEDVAGTVKRVIDGDTVDVATASGKVERVRIIGLDTPEVVDPRKQVQCFGREASNRAKELLAVGSAVTLQGDPTQDARDRYGRVLAHVLVDAADGGSPNFAVRMIAEGFAHHYVYRVPSTWSAELAAAQEDAKANARGLWAGETCGGEAYPKRDLEDDATPPGSSAIAVGEEEAPEASSGAPTGFDPGAFVGQGDRFNCAAFANQAQAQAVLRADPKDPNRLDPDRDGLACETLPAPKDGTAVKR